MALFAQSGLRLGPTRWPGPLRVGGSGGRVTMDIYATSNRS